MTDKNKLLRIIMAALFLALSYVLPYFTGQVPEIGTKLCPLHIPVILCGFLCGWNWGLAVGFIAPLFRSLVAGMPVLYPTAVCMAFELATYGAIAGLMHKFLPRKKLYIYCALIISMIVGRIIWGIAMFVCMGISGKDFTFAAFLAGAFTNAIPGIIVQIILIPILVMSLEHIKWLNTRE